VCSSNSAMASQADDQPQAQQQQEEEQNTAAKRQKQEEDTNKKVCVEVTGVACFSDGGLHSLPHVKFWIDAKVAEAIDAFVRLVLIPLCVDGTDTEENTEEEISCIIENLPKGQAALFRMLRKHQQTRESISPDAVENMVATHALHMQRRTTWSDEHIKAMHANDSKVLSAFHEKCKKAAREELQAMKENDFDRFFDLCKENDVDLVSGVFIPDDAEWAPREQKADLCVAISFYSVS
jgi:hypothetical protein